MDKTERLKKIISYLKWNEIVKTQKDFANIIEINKTNLSSALNGKEEYLTDNLFDKVLKKFPEISKEWLLTGKGEMLKSEHFSNIRNTNITT